MAIPGVKIYRKFYTEEKEMSNGVLAICVSKFPSQPYLILANMLLVSCSLIMFMLIMLILSHVGQIIHASELECLDLLQF